MGWLFRCFRFPETNIFVVYILSVLLTSHCTKGYAMLRAMKISPKKLILPNLPYLLIGLFATKIGQVWRLAEGANFSAKVLHLTGGFTAAFQNVMPSFHPIDLCVGVALASALRLAVYIKG